MEVIMKWKSLALLALLGCEEGKITGEASDVDGAEDSADEGAEEEAPKAVNGTISGTVEVQLYQSGDDGEREYVSWDEATGGVYIFGSIFVSSYFVDEEGFEHFTGDAVVENPEVTPNEYTLEMGLDDARGVYVYSIVDYWQDRIIGSSEPKGVYPLEVDVVNGADVTDIDMNILTPIYSGGGGCGGSGGGGGEGSGLASSIEISGDAYITMSYAGGSAAAMIMNSNNEGPYWYNWFTPESAGGGAVGSYGMRTCSGYGEMQLVAAWDSNGNNMIDPTDRWGAFAPTPDVDGNPIDIQYEDLEGYDLQIPLGDGPGLNMVPFVRLTGDVHIPDATFDELPSGTTVYVAALKYRPDGEFSVAELGSAYDLVTYEWPELTGETQKDYALTVPANTIAYLWAYADMDGNGVVNESGEPIASGGDENGKVPTGTTPTSSNDLSLHTANE